MYLVDGEQAVYTRHPFVKENEDALSRYLSIQTMNIYSEPESTGS